MTPETNMMPETKTFPSDHQEQDDDEEEETRPTGCCGILSRKPVLSILVFAAVGIGVGVGLSYWAPSNPTAKSVALKWIGLIGDLFIRALKCVVVPLVFVNVTISIIEMMDVGKASSIGCKTIGFYLLTTLAAGIFGISSSLIFSSLYQEGAPASSSDITLSFGCSDNGSFIVEGGDGNLFCSANYTVDDPVAQFTLVDTSGAIQTSSSAPQDDISLSDTIYNGVFTKIVTDNIVNAFAGANFAAVVFFSIVFGVALSQVSNKKKSEHSLDQRIILSFFKELNAVLVVIINWIIEVTPFAVLSLITAAIGSQDNLAEEFANVGYLILASVTGMIAQVVFIYIGLYAFVTKSNPFAYLKHIVPAQSTAFATASSAATIPMSIKSVLATGRVPETVTRFIIPLGATVNMDGSGIYYPCACIWLAILNGITPGIADYILLVVIAVTSSVGTSPVPSAGLVMILTAYNTVFNTTGTPEGFGYIIAIDWFMDRLQTVLNVTGDTVVCGMVSHLAPIEEDITLDSSGTSSEDEV